ncbi:hypothetical protein CEXT_441311 [Caerostris extrusa]|uniref:Uncharacterized protein n=1 Tax=Caerostris extrusa TaxID=172846 RepID=A0AAV4XKA8_CAEEX|nr:hypothetical protein CEXT_441311 [Caerostris extrusa]
MLQAATNSPEIGIKDEVELSSLRHFVFHVLLLHMREQDFVGILGISRFAEVEAMLQKNRNCGFINGRHTASQAVRHQEENDLISYK